MSDTGVFASRYTHMRRFGDLLDDVILHAHAMEGRDRDQLADVFERLASPATQGKIDTQVSEFLSRINAPDHWAEVATELRKQRLSRRLVDELEDLARRVDERLSETAAKMRGTGPW
jgi:hypothetical protein